MLYLGSIELADFDALDLELLELMAERLAIALERVHAFELERRALVCRPERDADHLSRLQESPPSSRPQPRFEDIADSLTRSLNPGALAREEVFSNLWLLTNDKLTLVPTLCGPPRDRLLTVVDIDGGGPLALATRIASPSSTKATSMHWRFVRPRHFSQLGGTAPFGTR